MEDTETTENIEDTEDTEGIEDMEVPEVVEDKKEVIVILLCNIAITL